MSASSGNTSRGYLPIRDYGLIGNCQTAALVATDGAIDWLCLPSFGDPSIFARILDAGHGGYFAITEPDLITYPQPQSQRYQGETAIVETIVRMSTGQLCIVDCMPMTTGVNAIIRQITALSGPCTF